MTTSAIVTSAVPELLDMLMLKKYEKMGLLFATGDGAVDEGVY